MRLIHAWLLLAGAALLAPQGCGEETPTEPSHGTTTTATGGSGPALKPPGGRCSCDADCEGEGALCLLGMCARRAQGFCPEPGAESGCEPGFRCFNTDVLADGGVCFPSYDPASCELVENRHELCSPTRADGCDPACGAVCTTDVTAPASAGAACDDDSDCTFNPDASCYADPGYGAPNGWVEGYCLAFGCTADGECGGPEKGCLPAASDGSGVCMERCGMDLDCRPGYVCRTIKDESEQPVGTACFAGCDAAATCPSGYTCLGEICVDETKACGPSNVNGWCPDETWCDEGSCNDQPFACEGQDDTLEPNDSQEDAKDAPTGVTEGLRSCSGNDDWYRVTVPAGKIVRVGIEFKNNAGDIDLVAYDPDGKLLGSRVGKEYPYSFRDQETDTEYYGFYSKAGASYYVRVVGYGSPTTGKAENKYSLHVDAFDYVDAESCTAAGFSLDECTGQGPNGSGLLPFPFADPDDGVVGDLYQWETYSNYRFARRETIMLVRHALAQTLAAFPDTTWLGLIDVCQIDGITPGYDVGSPRHPETTHDQGGNIDLAYFQTDGENDAEIICGDGSQHADGYCSPKAAEKHFVDLPRQAYLMAQLYTSPRTRVIGVDQVIGPLILAAAKDLNKLPGDDPKHISSAQLAGFNNKMAYGSGWPYHHHHIHVSLQWWTSGDEHAAAPDGSTGVRPSQLAPWSRSAATGRLEMMWPPRPLSR